MPIYSIKIKLLQVKKRDPFGRIVMRNIGDSDDEDDEKLSKNEMRIDEKGKPVGSLRFKTPPPDTPLTPEDLYLELSLKHYSTDHKKPKSMFTFVCMQVSILTFYINFLKKFNCLKI